MATRASLCLCDSSGMAYSHFDAISRYDLQNTITTLPAGWEMAWYLETRTWLGGMDGPV